MSAIPDEKCGRTRLKVFEHRLQVGRLLQLALKLIRVSFPPFSFQLQVAFYRGKIVASLLRADAFLERRAFPLVAVHPTALELGLCLAQLSLAHKGLRRALFVRARSYALELVRGLVCILVCGHELVLQRVDGRAQLFDFRVPLRELLFTLLERFLCVTRNEHSGDDGGTQERAPHPA